MARNGTWLLAVLAFAAPAPAGDSLIERWDKPRRETFSLKDAPPASVAEEIRKRYGVAFEADVHGPPRMDFEAKDMTFLEALDRFAAAQRLLVVRGERGLALVRPRRTLPPAPVAHAGPARLSVRSISMLAATHWTPDATARREGEHALLGLPPALRSYAADLDAEPRLRIAFEWMAEPGLEDVMLVGWSVSRAEDLAGRALAVKLAPELPVGAGSLFSADFEAPPAGARSVARLEGRVRFAVPLKESTVEFRGTDAWARKSFGDAHVMLEDVDAERAVVRFTLLGAPCEALAPGMSDRGRMLDGPAVRVGSHGAAAATAVTVLAYGPDGAEIRGSLTRTWSDVGSPNRTYWIDLDGPPQRIVLRTTTTAVVREAPFAFLAIPLPE